MKLCAERGQEFMRAALLGLLLVVGTLAAGCGGGGSSKTLNISDIGWTENSAIAELTKVLLEEELGYKRVTVRTSDLDSVFDDVANGYLDAFQDVWLPNQRDLLGSVEDDVELLDPWYQGQTKQGIAVPSYMGTTSLDQLNESEADVILGIEPSSVVMQRIIDEVIPPYDIHQKLVAASTDGMLAEIDDRYRNREDFAFVAWSPHWMNLRYDIRYLEDPKDTFGPLNGEATVHMIVNEGLPEADPEAYAFMNALRLTEEQVNDLEDVINQAGDPHEGARQWAQDNLDVVEPWLETARNARQA